MNILNTKKYSVVFYPMRDTPEQIDGLSALVKLLPYNINVVEIGSYAGESTSIFLNSNKINKIYCIDPWKNFFDKSDNAFHTNMKKIKSIFDNKFKNEKRVIQFIGTIDDFVKCRDLPHIDVVYIDGMHEYRYVKNDILITLKKIKPTLAIAGHDYSMSDVKNAIHDIIGVPDQIFVDSSWIKFLNNKAI